MRIKNYLFLGIAICLASLVLCQDTTEPITTVTPFNTTTSETTESTTTASSSTDTTTTTTTPETTTTTTPQTTTTPVTTTTSTTTVEPTTTTGPETDKVFNFTVPKNSSLPTCLRAKFSFGFDIQYPAIRNGTNLNDTVHLSVSSIDDYDGECADTFNTLSVDFMNGWNLFLNYTLEKNAYELSTIRLVYRATASVFPDVDPDYIGEKKVERSDLKEFAANKGNSFKCTSESKIEVERVNVDFKNYQAQPFIAPDSKVPDFNSAIECSADTNGTSKLVPIIVGSALAVLVILVLIAYIVGRRKHRPGYQQV